jgi:malonate decarboxylase delta subunit
MIELLKFEFPGHIDHLHPMRGSAFAGVVNSGNLEVLIESVDLGGKCQVEVKTSANGFSSTWAAVLEDFFARNWFADIKVSINDFGATPAVVSLRLDQAAAEMMEMGAK